MVSSGNKPRRIRASANLKGKTVRIEVILAGNVDVLWLDREEASNFISELRAAYKEVVAEASPAGESRNP